MKTINYQKIIRYFSYTLLVVVICSCGGSKVSEKTHAINLDMKIVAINSDCSLSNDKFRNPQLCNTILFVTLQDPKLYREINTCTKAWSINIDTKWLYNHRVGDTVHFDHLLKSEFFTIKER